MALLFDGTGYVTLASQWAPTNPLNFEFEIELNFPGYQGYNVWASLIGNAAQRGAFRVGNDKYTLNYEFSGSSTGFKYLTDGVVYATDVKIRVKPVSANSVEVYLNDAATPTETLTLDAGKEWVDWRPSTIGYRNSSIPELMPAGSKINSIKFTDLETPANSSIYLFNESGGTTLTDSGPLGNHGTLVGFSDPNSAWTNAPSVPETRKSSTFDVETALGTITTATLNSVDVFDHVTGQVGTTVSFAGAATDEITTSGEYTLTLGDGSSTEDITVQVNVVGLPSFNINKDGADQGSLTDVEFIILTGAAGSRAINQQITGITTTAGGDTGTIEITDAALDVDDTITVVQQSPTVGGGAVHTATLELI